MTAVQNKQPVLDTVIDEQLQDIWQPALSREKVEELVSNLEAALLSRKADAMFEALDNLLHLVELQAEHLSELQLPVKALSWRVSLIRVVASRTTHAMMRIPDFCSLLADPDGQAHALPARILAALNTFAAQSAGENTEGPFSPEVWIKRRSDLTGIRVSLGIAYYHLLRILELGGAIDKGATREMGAFLELNFDILFYAMTHGPLDPDGPIAELVPILGNQFDKAEIYLNQPQTAISQDPELFMLPRGQVLHVMTTMDRVRDALDALRN